MFMVQFLVDDRRLGDVLQLISGKVHDLKQQPIANVKVTKNGKAQAIHNVSNMRDALIPEMMKNDPEIKRTHRFTTDVVKQTLENLGGSRHSATSLLTRMIKDKQIRRVGRGAYLIIKR